MAMRSFKRFYDNYFILLSRLPSWKRIDYRFLVIVPSVQEEEK